MPEWLKRLRELEAASDLDPLQSAHIISPGYTHLANLTERIQEGGGKGGRGRVISMCPVEWSDYIAECVRLSPAMLDLVEALLREREAVHAYVLRLRQAVYSQQAGVPDRAMREIDNLRLASETQKAWAEVEASLAKLETE